MKTRKQLLSLVSLALATAPATAAPITVDEPSFEGAKALGDWVNLALDPVSPEPGASVGSLPGAWVDTGGQGSGWTVSSHYSGGIPDGDIYAFSNSEGSISQTLAETFQADTTYTLTVATGWRADLPGLGFPVYPGYGIELYAGTQLIASDYSTQLGGTGTGPAGDSWKDVTATYTYDPGDAGLVGQALEIRLLGGPNGVDPTYPDFAVQTNYDNVRLTAEPATAAPITVDEPSFEGTKALGGWVNPAGDPVSPEPGASVGSLPGAWVQTGGKGAGWTDPSHYSGGIPDGDIYAFSNSGGSISQTLAETFQADTTYTLTVATGWRADLPGSGFPVYPGYGIELYAGTQLIASDYSTQLGGTGTGPAGDSWKDVTATYTYDPGDAGLVGQALEIRLLGGPNGIDPNFPTLAVQTNYDNVRLTGGVPDIVDIAVDGSGNVILSLDGPAAGLTVEGSDDLTVGSFQDRNTAAPSGNTFTIPAADVDPNGDGKDFFRVRN